jgi:hypothetical protein
MASFNSQTYLISKQLNAGKLDSKLPMTLLVGLGFIPYIGLHNANPLYWTVLRSNEQKQKVMLCFTCLLYTAG